MADPISERIIIPMPKIMVERIDDFRQTTGTPTRSAAVRQLIELGLEAAQLRTAEGPVREYIIARLTGPRSR